MYKSIFAFILFLVHYNCNAQSNVNIDPCKIFGTVYIEKDRINATYRVYNDTTNTATSILVYKEMNKLYADKPGLWHFTNIRDFADFSIYLETNKTLADFVISYTKTESFAGCKD